MTRNDAIVEIKQGKLYYQDKMVFQDLNLSIKKQEFVSIIGASGCGKTTLLNAIGGFVSLDEGEIRRNGQKVLAPTKDCVMVFQDFEQLFPWMTLLENVCFPLGLQGAQKRTKEKKEALAKESIERVQLKGWENHYPFQLSGGMKQRGAIARALVTKPEMLLMDEPFGSLDMQTKSQLQDMLLSLWQTTRTTIVFVTHDVREALKLSQRIVVMKEGRIQKEIPNPSREIKEEKVEEIMAML